MRGELRGDREADVAVLKTTTAAIRSLQRMRLVAKTPASGGLSATVRIGATAEHPRFGRKPLSLTRHPAPVSSG